MLRCAHAHEQKAQGVRLIGVANKNAVLRRSWALSNDLKHNGASFFDDFDSLVALRVDNLYLHIAVRDIITHRHYYKIHFRTARLSRGTSVHHTRAIVTILLEFLYKWMSPHLVYTIA